MTSTDKAVSTPDTDVTDTETAVLDAAAAVVNAAASTAADAVVTPVDDFVNEAYDLIERWESRGEDYQAFAALPDVSAQRVASMDLAMADVRSHLSAMEDPSKVTGGAVYGPEQMLIDLRHLRELNKALAKGGHDLVARRVVAPRGKIKWGIDQVEAAGASPKDYAAEVDKFAYKLARALKAS